MSAAKEYAQELYSMMEDNITGLEGTEWYESAKRCALIAIAEIYKNNTDMSKNDYLCRVAEELNKL